MGGAAGGYTTGPKELIDLLKQRSRPYLFSNSLPPAVVASGIKVIDMLMQSSQFTEKVQKNTKRFRDRMIAAGFTIAGNDHPICPVMLGDAKLASVFADKMLGKIYKTHFINVNSARLPSMNKICFFFTVPSAASHTDKGIYVIGFSYPVVPKGKARIRVQISAAHTDQEIDECVDAFIEVGREFGVVN